MTPPRRDEFPVLVPESHAMGSIAVIRSLGRAGYPVHAISPHPAALGLRSHFATRAETCPSYQEDRIIEWTSRYVARHNIRAIVPSEGFLLATRPALDGFLPLMAVPQDGGRVAQAMCKSDVYEALSAGGEGVTAGLPPSIISEVGAPATEEQLASLPMPLFLKVDSFHDSRRAVGGVVKADTPRDARKEIVELHKRYTRVLIQGFVPGRGVGVFLLRWRGRELACFMHRRLHEVPHTGGASSMREAIRDETALDDARRKLDHLGWEGVAMLEYRREASGKIHFIELNARFWGSLHLALIAGVDFPTLLLDAFRGADPEPVSAYSIGTRCRITFPRDVEYAWSCLKDSNLSLGRRLWPIPEFLINGLDPRVRSDLCFPGDRGLWWNAFGNFLGSTMSSILGKIFLKRS